jgi:hypothetical protein
MGYDDRHPDRGNWRGGRDDSNRERGRGGDDRGFFERASDEVGSWFGGGRDDERNQYGRSNESSYDRGYGRDSQDRDPGAHKDYYRGGDRGQRRMGPEGGFEMQSDYRRSDRHADQGKSWGSGGRDEQHRYSSHGHGGSETGSFSGSGGVSQSMGEYGEERGGYGGGGADGVFYGGGGAAGPGFDPNFAGGPRFDRADVGSTGTHGAHPVASPYGEAQSGGYSGGSSARSRAILQQHERQQAGGQSGQQMHDPHYSAWRRQQIESLDRDYHEYRQENASRFESEFGSWREKRGQQRQSMGRVTEHMEVVGSDEQHVGTVDKVKDGRIILTKSDPSAGGHHHSIPCGWLESVDDKVRLNKTAEQAMQAWRDEETSRALFEREDSGSSGPHVLERSFSGTYRDE